MLAVLSRFFVFDVEVVSMESRTAEQEVVVDEKAVLGALQRAIQAIRHNDPKALQESFVADASFFVGRNSYRVDDLETFRTASQAFFDAGGKITHFDVRQARVVVTGPCAVVAFHYAQRSELGDVSVGVTGRGSAVLSASNGHVQVIHLHLTENQGSSTLPVRGASALAVLGAVERIGASAAGALHMNCWGTE